MQHDFKLINARVFYMEQFWTVPEYYCIARDSEHLPPTFLGNYNLLSDVHAEGAAAIARNVKPSHRFWKLYIAKYQKRYAAYTAAHTAAHTAAKPAVEITEPTLPPRKKTTASAPSASTVTMTINANSLFMSTFSTVAGGEGGEGETDFQTQLKNMQQQIADLQSRMAAIEKHRAD